MKRYKKKSKIYVPPVEPAKSIPIVEVDWEHIWCPRCGKEGEKYLLVSSTERHYYYLDEIHENGDYEGGEEVDYEPIYRDIYCSNCNALNISAEEIYKFSKNVITETNIEEENYSEVAEQLIRQRRDTEMPF